MVALFCHLCLDTYGTSLDDLLGTFVCAVVEGMQTFTLRPQWFSALFSVQLIQCLREKLHCHSMWRHNGSTFRYNRLEVYCTLARQNYIASLASGDWEEKLGAFQGLIRLVKLQCPWTLMCS